MAKKNPNYRYLSPGTTHGEIIHQKILNKVSAYRKSHPHQPIYMMGWGQTTQPISPIAVQALQEKATLLGNVDTYTSYEDIIGSAELRTAICSHFYHKQGIQRDYSEIFMSDGAQSAATNILELFDLDDVVAVQNPVYPSYIEAILLSGRDNYISLECSEQNNFFPIMPEGKIDLIYLCFPNNPTGAAATKAQLKTIVDYARSNHAVIIFDATYSGFVRTENVPRSIYEISGAEECAIEIGSFSKIANFTGLRVGWCVIPHNLKVENSTSGELQHMWHLRHAVKFWGPSNVAQYGAIACLTAQGWRHCLQTVDYYMQNARILKQGLEKNGISCFGGTDNPYLWLKAPKEMTSWQFFEHLFQNTGIVGIPGNLYGSAGEGYLRLSTFGHRKEIEDATDELVNIDFAS